MPMTNTLSIYDYSIFSIILAASFVTGIYTGFRKNKDEKDYFLASKSFGFLPVGLSLLSTALEPIHFLGLSAEAYYNGIQLMLSVIAAVIAGLFASYAVIPVYYNLQITTINEYLELRFGSRCLRKSVMFLMLIRKILYTGILLYTPALALSAVTPLSTNAYIYIMGVVCATYASLGGMRAVIMTDVFQMVVTVAGIVAIITIVLLEVGSFEVVWSLAKQNGRLNVLNMNPSLQERYNFYNVLNIGFFIGLNYLISAQEVVQRLCTVKTLKDAKRVAVMTPVGSALIHPLFYLLGVVMYAFYYGCDPLSSGKIERDQILPYFIMENTRSIYGFPGLFIGVLFATSLSSMSSMLNSCVAIFWKDFLQDFGCFKNMSNAATVRTSKFFSFIFGGLIIATAIMATKLGQIIQISLSITSIMSGPICGIFLLGLFFPTCKATGAILGLVFSWLITTWIAVGSFICASQHASLPMRTDLCNSTSLIESLNATSSELSSNNGTSFSPATSLFKCQELEPLYSISFTLYSTISVFLCLFVGMLHSLIVAGNSKGKLADKKLISTFVWRFYNWGSASSDKQEMTTYM